MSETKRINELLNEVYAMMADIMRDAYGWDVLDKYVADFDIENVDRLEILTVLRSTFVIRDKLPSWENALIRGRVALLNKNYDPDILLKGLEKNGPEL